MMETVERDSMNQYIYFLVRACVTGDSVVLDSDLTSGLSDRLVIQKWKDFMKCESHHRLSV